MATGTQQQQNQKTEQGSENQADRPGTTRQTDFEARRPRQKLEPDSEEYGTELKYRSAANVGTGKLAKGLGYFSIGLGLMELLMPAQVGEMIGVSNRYRAFLPVLGLREIAHGVAILSQQKPTEGVWSRVAGDAVDLAFLAAAFAGEENNKNRLAGATIAVLGVTALDVMCAQALSSEDWGASINPTAPTNVGQPSARQSPADSESL
ncbi:MAG TPA: hypothetical protein VF599_02965 [Pyrinomonadaceae bacterium]